MLEESRKRHGSDVTVGEEETGKRARTPAMSDEDEYYCYNTDEVSIKEETIAEVMKLLEKELGSSIKESCGPCVSDESSSVMASIDMSGFTSISQLMQYTHQSHVFSYSYPVSLAQSYCVFPSYDLKFCQCQSCLNNAGKIYDQQLVGEEDEQKDKEEVSGSDEKTNGCDREENDDDDWLEALLSWDECPLDLGD